MVFLNWLPVQLSLMQKMKLLTLVLVCFAFLSATAQSPDLILTNGKIFTSDTTRLFTEAIAIKGDRILATGNTATIEKLAGKKTKRINLQGRTVIPGINDAHDHVGFGTPFGKYIAFTAPMLPGPTFQQVLDSLSLAVQQVPKGTLIQGDLGLLIIEDTAARRTALDNVAPDHPVILNAPWGHGTLLNTKALQMLGITDEEKDPVGGAYERQAGSQKITGFLKEYAEFEIKRRWYSKLANPTLVKGFQQYGSEAVRLGITSVQNMATSLDLPKMMSVLGEAQLPLRVRVIRFPGSSATGRQLSGWTTNYSPKPLLQVNGMKWILDATPLERGAFMQADYSDKPGVKGQLNFPVDTIRKILKEGLASKEQLLLHIVGDATPAIVITEMLKMAPAAVWKAKRVRFEHADGLLPEMYDDVKQLGIIPVVNPSHFMFAEVNKVRVGERAKHYQPFRSFLAAGIPVAIGSDGPNNPYLNIMFAAMHPTNQSEVVTREQSVMAYTTGSAHAEGKEKEKGKIKAGMLADITVLSQDIFTVPLPDLPRTASVLTIIGGRIVYDEISPGKK
jgi:predicted amidohydrolase YtcJ